MNILRRVFVSLDLAVIAAMSGCKGDCELLDVGNVWKCGGRECNGKESNDDESADVHDVKLS